MALSMDTKNGRSGRIRTPDHWFWSLMVSVLTRTVSYVLDPLGGIVGPIFVPTIPYRHVYSLEVG